MAEESYRPLERRPIASRDLEVSRRVASWLARRGASPNLISVAGMASGIAAGLCLYATSQAGPFWQRVAWVGSAAFLQLRLTANLLDGMVAIESGRASPLGELYNEVPDRVSDAAAFIGAGYAAGGHVALGYGAACVAIFTAYVRAMGKVAGASQEYCGPMAKQHRVFVMTVVALYCGLTPQSWQPDLILSEWTDPPIGLAGAGLALIIAGGLWTAARRLRRIASNLKGQNH